MGNQFAGDRGDDKLLVVMHGSAGCGKSTVLHRLGLDPYVVCADTLRLQMMPPVPDPERPGHFRITNEFDAEVWRLLDRIVRARAERGVPLIAVDAQHTRIRDVARYEGVADEFGYRLVVLDMSYVPADEVKERNASRPDWKRVPDSVVDRFYAVDAASGDALRERFECVNGAGLRALVEPMARDGRLPLFGDPLEEGR